MLWGCFSARDPGELLRIQGIMDSIKYQQILDQNLTVSARKLQLGRGQIFQQDTNPTKPQNQHRNASVNTKSRFCHDRRLT
ncbi:hypothetical protein LDENG_00023260 [Lucifuga dentata]|nr:hypothetical protein LDENG_00023260 [Lucifuga dentata]